MNNLLEYALQYAARGWKIFPLSPGSKEPTKGSHGVKDATSVESIVAEWWRTNPNYNIGLACGSGSGVYVVDVDRKMEALSDGSSRVITDGFASCTEHKLDVGHTVFQITPRGGMHCLYRHPLGNNDVIGNKVNFVPNVDIRGEGGYIVLAPSRLNPYDFCPGGGFYQWGSTCDPWHVALAEFPAHFLAKPVAPVLFKGVPLVTQPTPGTPRHCRIMERATLYVHECDPAVQGMNGHSKLFWAAQCMVNGFCLSDSQAFSILASDFNPMCSPPWNLSNQSEHRDFYRKISEARKTPPRDKKIGWLLDEFSLSDDDLLAAAEDVKSMLSKINRYAGKTDFEELQSKEKLKRRKKESEHDFLVKPTGLLGEICSWMNSTSLRYQPLLALGCSITFLGALFGRKVRDTLGNRTNLYCMGVGDSSSGKGHGPEQIHRLCEASNCLELIGGCNTTSDSGIEERLSRFPSTLFFWDEIGHLLADFKSGQGKTLVVPTLMNIWSAAKRTYLGKEYASSDNQRRIVQPNCCIWGSTTPDRFTRGLSPEELRDGWIGRVLVFQTNTKPPVNDDYKETPVPEHLITACHEWMGRGKKIINGTDLTGFASASFTEAPPAQIVVPLTSDARLIMKSFRVRSEKKSEEKREIEYLWAKAVEQAHRISLIVAASEGTPKIEINSQCADYSCRLVSFLVDEFGRTILPRIAGSELEVAKMKIIDVVKSYGKKGISKNLLTRKTQWASGPAREGMIKDLVEAGQLIPAKKENSLCFWTEENHPKDSE